MKKYDCIVIGAGIAGVTFAYLMKKANKKVLLIEKQNRKTKNKLCGGLLSKKSYQLLHSIFEIDKEQFHFHEKLSIHNDSTKLEVDASLYAIDRKYLDAAILDAYICIGGEFLENTQYTSIDFEQNVIEISQEKYCYDYLIAADGVFSMVRKQITGRIQRKNFALEISAHLEDHSQLEIYFFKHLKGYCWRIPNQQNQMIGIGDISRKTNLSKQFSDYLKAVNMENKNIRGAFLPTGNDIYLQYKNVYFIGDSAGLISPITGEGIYYALYAAKVLSENLGKQYKRKMKKVIRKINAECFYKRFVYCAPLRNIIFMNYHNRLVRNIVHCFLKKIV